MKLSKQSKIAYAVLILSGALQLLLTFGPFGSLFALLFFVGGAPMVLIGAHGISKRSNVSELANWQKVALGIATASTLCAVSLMIWLIVALRNFQ
jgi:hypothetical protein